MRRIRITAYATIVVGVFGLGGAVMAQTMQFPVDRDAGLDGFAGEDWVNTGASPQVRGAKGNQHAAIFDWSRETKDSILAFMAGIDGPIEVTFSFVPRSGPPGGDIGIETIDSKEDWVEGDDAQGG